MYANVAVIYFSEWDTAIIERYLNEDANWIASGFNENKLTVSLDRTEAVCVIWDKAKSAKPEASH